MPFLFLLSVIVTLTVLLQNPSRSRLGLAAHVVPWAILKPKLHQGLGHHRSMRDRQQWLINL